MGAASGLFATLLFVIAFIIFLSTDPSGGNQPALPNVVPSDQGTARHGSREEGDAHHDTNY
jgi:hypothetical protein